MQGGGTDVNIVHSLIQVLYSRDNDALMPVTQPTYNNLSGKAPTTLGETHFGLQKRPIGATIFNFLTEGTQEFGINEALFLGGIFQDESTNGCITGASLQQTNTSTSNGTAAQTGGVKKPTAVRSGVTFFCAVLVAVIVLDVL